MDLVLFSLVFYPSQKVCYVFPSLRILLTLCHQPIRPIQMMLTSASFGGSFFMSHFHIFCNHFGLVRSLLKSFNVLMDTFGASYGEWGHTSPITLNKCY